MFEGTPIGTSPERKNIVVSSTLNKVFEGFTLAKTINEALELCEGEIFIIGGEKLYRSFLETDLVKKLYVTEVKVDIEGDAYFPEIDMENWREVSRIENGADNLNPYNYDFVVYSKKAQEV